MSMSDEGSIVPGVTFTLQIITGALVAGLTVFLVITVFINLQKQGKPPGADGPAPILLPFAFGFAAVALVLSVVVPRTMVASQRRQIAQGTWNPNGQRRGFAPPSDMKEVPDEAKLVVVYQAQKIVGAALNEGAAFFALIVYMLGGHPLALGLALVLIATQVLRIPTREKVERWIDEQAGLIQQERQLGG